MRGCLKTVAILFVVLIVVVLALQFERGPEPLSAVPIAPINEPERASATPQKETSLQRNSPTSTRIPPTRTPIPPTRTPIPPTATRVQPTAASFVVNRFSAARTRYTHGVVNLREGPGTSYDLAGSVAANSKLQLIGQSGNWYMLTYGGREVFIAGWLTYDALPQPAPRQQPVQQQPAQPQQPAQQQPAQQPVQQQPSYTCNCSKTCGAMSSCREAYFQLNNCGCRVRDRDKDGVPCESICPGG